MAQLNRNNFIRWYDSNAESQIVRTRFGAPGQCRPMPVWIVGEYMNIYFNHKSQGASYGNVDLCDASGTVVSSTIGELLEIEIIGGSHSRAAIQCPNVTAGYYKLKIGSRYSNLIEIRAANADLTECPTVQFQHNGNIISSGGSFLYKYVPTFAQKFRLPMFVFDFDFELEKEVYEESSTQNIRANNQRTRKWVKYKVEYVDDDTIEAIASMLTHNSLKINGIDCVLRDGTFIEKEFDPLEKLNNIYFTVYELQASLSSFA